MTKRLFVSVWALTVLFAVCFAATMAAAGDGMTIISYQDNFKAFAAGSVFLLVVSYAARFLVVVSLFLRYFHRFAL